MGKVVEWLDKTLYPGYGKNWDDELFRQEILKVLQETDCVLDLGAGAGIVSQMNFRGLANKVCGIDPEPRVTSNPYLDEAKLGNGEDIPYADAMFDLVFADNVLEHLANPTTVFREVARVLKPGGRFLAKTPNRWHYMPLIAQLTPHSFHRYINHRRGRSGEDTFPTRYHANTPPKIERIATESGLKLREATLIEGRPEYLRFNAVTYLVGYLYERLVNFVPGFSRFRITLIAHLEKPLSG